MIPIVALMKLKNSIKHIHNQLGLMKNEGFKNFRKCVELHIKTERYFFY